jgi:acetyl-CoA synthetase
VVAGPGSGEAAADVAIDVLLEERREYPPPPEFVAQAVVSDPDVYPRAEADLDGFWLEHARSLLDWYEPPTAGLDWDPPHCTWFADGVLNVSVNCLDRHVAAGNGDRVAYHVVPEPVDEPERVVTYADLLADVCRLANALRGLGVGKGDVVGIYMGMVPELPVAMLACARIGAPHVVVFGGFSAGSLGERLESTGAKVLITQDEAWRKGGRVPLKATADDAAPLAPTVGHMIVLRRTGADVAMTEGRDHWWHELVEGQADTCEPERVEAEHTLYALHTSGTTAKPKAAVHTSGGYLTYVALTHRWIFDIHPDRDVWWCAADIGWVTGHSYIVYGPLANGTTSVLYEGDPMFPGPDRHWRIIAGHRVTQYYTAPTLIRAFIKAGTEQLAAHDLTSLRLLGTVGEPINPEAWVWYWKHVGGGRCPVVDTWWQTETGGILITPLPALVTQKPGSATRPFPGIAADVVDDHGRPVERGRGGYLVINRPWPGMFRTLYLDDERYVSNYFSRFGERVYFPGDGARQDEDGDFWLLGRVDDVMNVSGHRLSTIELESTLVEHPAVAEAAATAAPDALTGQTPLCFVLLRSGYEPSDELAAELREWIGERIGKIARPKAVIIADDLPKTRSGKIMRRLLRDIAEGHELGDTTTLRDPAVVDDIKRKAEAVLSPGR